MGRRKIDRGYQEALLAIRDVGINNPQFVEDLQVIARSVVRHEAKRQDVRRQELDRLAAIEEGKGTVGEDPDARTGAVFPDWGWMQTTVDEEGRISYSGPGHDLRVFCDAYHLPWPESGKILLQFITSGRIDPQPPALPSERAVQAWRMAATGLGWVRENELAQMAQLGLDIMPHRRKRNFSKGLSQGAVAALFGVEERQVREWIADCWRYARTVGISTLMTAAGLSFIESVAALIDEDVRERIRRKTKQEE